LYDASQRPDEQPLAKVTHFHSTQLDSISNEQSKYLISKEID